MHYIDRRCVTYTAQLCWGQVHRYRSACMENNLKDYILAGSSCSSRAQGPDTLQNITQSYLHHPLPRQEREARKDYETSSIQHLPCRTSWRAHPPSQSGFGAKVSTGSYLTRTLAPNPAKGWPKMSQPLVLNQQNSGEGLQRQLPARMGLDWIIPAAAEIWVSSHNLSDKERKGRSKRASCGKESLLCSCSA